MLFFFSILKPGNKSLEVQVNLKTSLGFLIQDHQDGVPKVSIHLVQWVMILMQLIDHQMAKLLLQQMILVGLNYLSFQVQHLKQLSINTLVIVHM